MPPDRERQGFKQKKKSHPIGKGKLGEPPGEGEASTRSKSHPIGQGKLGEPPGEGEAGTRSKSHPIGRGKCQ